MKPAPDPKSKIQNPKFYLLPALLVLGLLAHSPVRAATGSGSATATTDTRDYTLTVAPTYGNPSPPVGTTNYAWHATVTASVEATVSNGGTTYTCTGWTCPGAVPATGLTNNTGDIMLTEVASSLAWQWQTSATDTDSDGLPDAWEQEHFGNLTTSNGTGDFDRDGRSDAQELADNTDPANPGSALGLVAYYPFDGNANDASGHGNNGTPMQGADFDSGVIGQALELHGGVAAPGTTIGDHVIVPNSESLAVSNALTLTLWVRFDHVNSLEFGAEHQALMMKGSSQHNYGLMYDPSGPNLNFYHQGLSASRTSANWPDRASNTWYFVAATFDGETDTVKVYIDGQSRATSSNATGAIVGNSESLAIGRAMGTWYQYWLYGNLDDVRIYNRALSSKEVAQLYASTVPPTTHTVTFDLDGKGERTGGGALVQQVAHGGAAVAPTVAGLPGWAFTNWDRAFNNVTGPLTVKALYTALPLLDLTLTSSDFRILNAAGAETSNPAIGEAVTLEVTVHNTGAAATAGNVQVRIFENGSPADLTSYNITPFSVAASGAVVESIPAGGSATLLLPWTASAPARVATLTVVAEFAANRAASQAGTALPQPETGYANNSVGRSLQIGSPTLPPGFGITVDATAPTTMESGVRYTLSGTAAYAWDGNNPVLGAEVTVTVGGQTYPARTATPNGAWSVLLNGLPAGTHTAVISVTDGNANGSKSLDLNVVGGAATIDLRVTQIGYESGTYRSSGETGWASNNSAVTLKALVRNDGNTAAGPFAVQFKAPNGSTIATVNVPGGLAALSETPSWITATAAWTATPVGAQSVSVVCDSGNAVAETAEDNNTRSATVQVTANQPDLVVADIVWSPGTPTDGDAVTFTATVRNDGAAAVASDTSFNTRFTLNGSIQGTTSHTLTSDLATGGTVQVQATLSAAVLSGGRSLVAEADVNDAIPELNETNNSLTKTVTIRAALPDLRPFSLLYGWQQVSGLGFSPSNPVTGDVVAITCEVWNAGTVAVPAGGYMVAFTAAGGTPWTETLTLAQPLAPGASATVSTQWTSTGSGSVAVAATVDSTTALTEESESNNATSKSLTVYPQAAGLALTALVAAPAQAYPNSLVTLTATVTNNGGTDSAGGHTVTFYNGDPDSGGTLIGTPQTIAGPIPAKGGSATAQIPWTTPAIPQTVSLFAVMEGSKLQSALTVTNTPAPDFAVYAGDIHLNPSQPTGGQSVDVSATVRHLGGSAGAALVTFQYNTSGAWVDLGSPVPVDSADFTGGEQSVSAHTVLVASGHYYTVRVTVEPQGAADANAANNTATSSLRRADAPWADAGPNQQVWTGQTVTLDGSGSANAGTYQWTLASRPAGSTAALAAPTTAAPTFTADVAGAYEVRLVVSDGLVDSPSDTAVITVTNGTPTALTLDPATVAENSPAGTLVGTLAGSGGSGSYTYALAVGEGATDNTKFSIAGAQLKVAGTLDYELQTTASIRVRVTDTHSGNHYEKPFTLTLLDDTTEDGDTDGLTDAEEDAHGTSRTNSDTDGDGLQDGAEVNTHHTNPILADTDGDGLNDKTELDNLGLGLNPTTDQSALIAVITGAIRNSPAAQQAHGLYTEDAIRNIRIGAPLIKVTNGEVRLELQLQKSDDLETWTDFGDLFERTDTTPGNRVFYRLFFNSTEP